MNDKVASKTGSVGMGGGLFSQMFPVIFAVVSTVLFRLGVAATAEEGGFVYNLFLPSGGIFGQLVPMGIMFVFFWTVCDLALKIVDSRRQGGAFSSKAIQACPGLVAHDRVEEAIDGLSRDSEAKRGDYVHHSIGILLEHYRLAGDSQGTHDFFRHKVDLDAEAASGSYTVARVFIWAMPILGFIGTVIGISLAVGEFSGFLSGDIDNIDIVKQELASVSSGLAFAFNTTLLGLVTSLLAMLMMTYAQRRTELLTKGVEELGLDIIASGKRESAAGHDGLTGMGDDGLIDVMQGFVDMVNSESERLRGGFEAFNTQFAEVGARIAQTYSGLGETLEQHTSKSAQQMEEATGQLAHAMTDASGAFHEATAAMSRDLQSFAPDLDGTRKAIAEGLDRVEKYNTQFEEVLWANTQEVVSAQQLLGTKINEGMEKLEKSNAQFEGVLQSSAQQLMASNREMSDQFLAGLGQVERSGQQVEAVLQSNTEQLQRSGEQVQELLRTSNDQVQQVLRTNNDQVQQLLSTSSDEVKQVISTNSDQVQNVLNTNSDQVQQALNASSDQVQQVLSTNSDQVKEVMRGNAEQLVDAQQKLGEKVEAIRPTNDLIDSVARSISESSGTMLQVKNVHETLLPVLKGLSGPLEFRMVPAGKKDEEQE